MVSPAKREQRHEARLVPSSVAVARGSGPVLAFFGASGPHLRGERSRSASSRFAYRVNLFGFDGALRVAASERVGIG